MSLFHIHDFPPSNDSFWETRPILSTVIGVLALPLVPLAVWTVATVVRFLRLHS